MPRPKGSKNKPKINKVNPVEDNTLFHWNETIQKLNDMKEKGDWTEEPLPSTKEQPPSTEEQPELESKEPKKGRKSSIIFITSSSI